MVLTRHMEGVRMPSIRERMGHVNGQSSKGASKRKVTEDVNSAGLKPQNISKQFR